MALRRKPSFYSAQLKRLLVQIMSCFSGYQVVTGNQRDGQIRYLDVPIIYGDLSRTVGYIVQGGGNGVQYLPCMSCYMTGMRQNSELRRSSQTTKKTTYTERAKSPEGDLLINVPGKTFMVEQYQPIPYEISFDIAILASNNDQLFQLLEQICVVFSPEMDILLSNSPIDMTFMTTLIFQGDVNFEKVVPTGTEIDALNVATLSFKTTIWLSLPAKVSEAKLIYDIEVPISQIDDALDSSQYEQIDGLVIKADETDILKFESF